LQSTKEFLYQLLNSIYLLLNFCYYNAIAKSIIQEGKKWHLNH